MIGFLRGNILIGSVIEKGNNEMDREIFGLSFHAPYGYPPVPLSTLIQLVEKQTLQIATRIFFVRWQLETLPLCEFPLSYVLIFHSFSTLFSEILPGKTSTHCHRNLFARDLCFVHLIEYFFRGRY